MYPGIATFLAWLLLIGIGAGVLAFFLDAVEADERE